MSIFERKAGAEGTGTLSQFREAFVHVLPSRVVRKSLLCATALVPIFIGPAALTFMTVGAAQAGPTACTLVNSTNRVWTCSGDQSGGITVGGARPPNPAQDVRTLNVNNLSTNMSAGIGFYTNVFGSPTLNVDTGTRTVTSAGRAILFQVQYTTGTGAKPGQISTASIAGPSFATTRTSPFDQSNSIQIERFGGTGKDAKSGGGGNGGSGGPAGPIEILFAKSATYSAATSVTALNKGIYARAIGGLGGQGASLAGSAGAGGNGGGGGAITLRTTTNVVVNTGGIGIDLQSRGGAGRQGKSSIAAGQGGNGGGSQIVSLNYTPNGKQPTGASWTVNTTGASDSSGIRLLTQGGDGGKPGVASTGQQQGGGAAGDSAGASILAGPPITVTTVGTDSHGVWVLSQGGAGGAGTNTSSNPKSSKGGAGGRSSTVSLNGTYNISTSGAGSDGVVASSVGGAGGSGGKGAGAGGSSGNAFINIAAGSKIETAGDRAVGLAAQAIGGRGGIGSTTSGVVAFGANGGSGGSTGFVDVRNSGSVTTRGFSSAAILAESVGGAGGSGGAAFSAFYSKGGTGAQGGDGNSVNVQNNAGGTLSTDGHASPGIIAQSIGGTGGNGGGAGAIVALGGRSSGTSDGGDVTVTNNGDIKTGQNPKNIATDGLCPVGCSFGISAQSIGGGGGNGGTTGGWFAIGGQAGGGGDGGTVNVTNTGTIVTELVDSPAIKAQSIGGGGGNGGSTVALGAVVSAGIGGSGGKGGHASDVTVNGGTALEQITTSGARSQGILAQSIGGGGGRGGFSTSVAVGVQTFSVSAAIGGAGGSGGNAGNTSVTAAGAITTKGLNAGGVVSQSIGGGGGNGGFAVSVSASNVGAVAIGVGGKGGGAAEGGTAKIDSAAAISTSQGFSPGLLAQSIGGGGGNGGASVSVSGSFNGAVSGAASVGGSGGGGGDASSAIIASTGTVSTTGHDSPGIQAQSIGGGGGNGGVAVAVPISNSNSVGIAIGGSATKGGSSVAASGLAAARVTSSSEVQTTGHHSTGILVQSIGGGGGNGGTSVAASLSAGSGVALNGAIGGTGGAGGSGGEVSFDVSGDVSTRGDHAGGVVAQSIGGGGGNGGASIAGAFTVGNTQSLGVSLGGSGGVGGQGGEISTSYTRKSVSTSGLMSDGVTAQSIGGSGGRGGLAIAGSLTTKETTNINVAIGGSAGSGVSGGPVNLTVGDVDVSGAGSRGVVAQSIGGGGGNGGYAITGNFTTAENTKELGVSVGGGAGAGGTAGTVFVYVDGTVSTGGSVEDSSRSDEYGVLAQAIGGGGGSGGLAANANASKSNKGGVSLGVAVGGGGGSGGLGGSVAIQNDGSINTLNTTSHGILAQSIGGGGGAGGGTATFDILSTASSTTSKTASVTVGGSGGGSARSGQVFVENTGSVTVQGIGSSGVVAQSIAGGGGVGGGNIYKNKKGDKSVNTLTVGVGGKGGVGSNANSVRVVGSDASVTTGEFRVSTPDGMPYQRYSGSGYLLQSIGGGGGSGGVGIQGNVEPTGNNATAAVGVGGKGGVGGNGGAVVFGGEVKNLDGTYSQATGTIFTIEALSPAIQAQSIGGGGGTGGAGIVGDVTNSTGKNLTVGVGNFGGSGGDASTVAVYSDTGIRTTGDGSKGIMAQSVGGGGGSGGAGVQGNISSKNDDGSTEVVLGIGLNGGAAGNGGAVTVVAGGTGIKAGDDAQGSTDLAQPADGIFAQSVGGSGGSGGVGLSGGTISTQTKNKAASLNIGVGKNGGGGGTGGSVRVTSHAPITAKGTGSRGIFAQSIGGGGGDGALGVASDIKTAATASTKKNTDDRSDSQLTLGLGGNGGTGGASGQTVVQNTGTIATARSGSDNPQGQMHGIMAQSIGGGGGNGGIGMSGDINGAKGSKALTLAIGGGGGGGGSAFAGTLNGSVTSAGVGVSNTSSIWTVGDGSVGIYAQSIGGGGGNGAVGLSGKVDSGDGKAVTIAVGGRGGSGGAGGTVFVNNSGAITTDATTAASGPDVNQAHAIFAQSVGGGGGSGMHTGSLTYGSTNSGTTKGVSMAVGASGSGGAGKNVRVDNSGNLQTTAGASHLVFAQSVGGGGGQAGSLGGIGTEGGANTWEASIAVGGGGDDDDTLPGSGDGGAVVVNHTDTKSTASGAGSFGIFAQSIGGGGGTAANGSGLDETGQDDQSTSNANVGINIGAKNASSGAGGNVTVNASGVITTKGKDGVGIFGQSVGGGGGVAGLGVTGLSGSKLTVGGTGTTVGSAGSVSITSGSVSTGAQTAKNTAAHGVVAQSIGGGGGYGGNVILDQSAVFGTDLTDISKGTDTIGSGGPVKVSVPTTKVISTSGDYSVGVIGQSVGGGGGVAGKVSDDGQTLFGSSGGGGDAALVALDVQGYVVTSGVESHGVLAQSAGGAKAGTTTSTKVDISVGGRVETSGAGAHGLVAQSIGGTAGVIEIDVEEGGTVLSGPQSAAIFAHGGANGNILRNSGSISTADGKDGNAFYSVTESDFTIDNSGTIVGSVTGVKASQSSISLKTTAPSTVAESNVTLRNRTNGRLEAGDRLHVRELENAGRLVVGGLSNVGATHIAGDFTQTETGVTAVEIDLSVTEIDLLTIGGAAKLDGAVDIEITDLGQDGPLSSAPGSLKFAVADGGTTLLSDLEVIGPVAGTYDVEQQSDGSLHAVYDVDFDSAAALASTNDNQDKLLGHIDALFEAGILGSEAEEIGLALLAFDDGDDFAAGVDALSGELFASTQLSTLQYSARFSDSLMSCSAREGGDRFVREGSCSWVYFGGTRLDQSASGTSLGFSERAYQLAAGKQFEVSPDTHLGFGVAYRNTSIDVGTSATSEGDQFQLGVAAKKQFGNAMISASLSGGFGSFDSTRSTTGGGVVFGDQDIWNVSGQIRGEYTFAGENWYAKPRIDLGVDYVNSGSFVETGGSGSLAVSGFSDTYLSIQPAVEVGGEFTTDDGTLVRLSAAVGLTHYLNDAAPSVTSRFGFASGFGSGATSQAQLDRTYYDLSAGVEFLTAGGANFKVQGFGSFSENSELFGAQFKLEIPF